MIKCPLLTMKGRGTMTDYRIIDVHNHIYPEKIAKKASESIGSFYGGEAMFHEGTGNELAASIKRAGIEKAIICSAATVPSQVEAIDDFIASECQKHPEFIGFGTMHIDYEEIDKEIKRIKTLGLRGVKLHPDFQKFFIDDFRALPMYRSIKENDLILLCHMGDNKRPYSQPHRMAAVLDKVPGLKVIAAHFGGYRVWEEALYAYKPGSCYFDISSSLRFIDKEMVYKFFDKYGIDSFFWGTDFPMWDHEKELEFFLSLGLSHEQNQKILYDNFEKAFGI